VIHFGAPEVAQFGSSQSSGLGQLKIGRLLTLRLMRREGELRIDSYKIGRVRQEETNTSNQASDKHQTSQ
jgi:hypothetical protein